MKDDQAISRMDVLRYVLAVEFSKIEAPPFDPYKENDLGTLLEVLPQYHDGPRNSPTHLYAALADDSLDWRKTAIPVPQLIRGPGATSEETKVTIQAEGFINRFVRLVQEQHSASEYLRPYFWDADFGESGHPFQAHGGHRSERSDAGCGSMA